jgi:hypothetical protein
MTRKLKGKPQYPYTFSRGQDFPVVIQNWTWHSIKGYLRTTKSILCYMAEATRAKFFLVK